MEVFFTKTPAGLIPAEDEDREKIRKWKTGALIKGEFTQPRNPKFLRKFMALINLGFEAWEPREQEYKGHAVQKNRERFRADVTIAAGFYDLVVDLHGGVHAKAHSISFASMSEDEFEKVYSAVVDVLLQDVLKSYTREDLDRVIEEILAFG